MRRKLNHYTSISRSFLMFILILVLSAAGQASTFDVSKYVAKIEPDLINKSVKGDVLVRFSSLKNGLTEITLNAGVLSIDAIKENAVNLKFQCKDKLLKIQLGRPLKQNEICNISIIYHGVPEYGMEFFSAQNQVYTEFSTSQWMPCVDDPNDRAVFLLNLISPDGLKTIGNGRLVSQSKLADGKVSTIWEQKNPVPTYLFGFAFGDFRESVVKHGRTTFRYLADKSFSENDLKNIFRDTGDMLDFYESKAGVKYPDETYGQILAMGGAKQEMSSFTALNDEYGRSVLKNEKEIWLGVHEFAHQWWGNMVTNRSWTDFWLNEGIANFMTAAYFEHRFGHDEYLLQIDNYKKSYEEVRDAGHDKSLVFPEWNKPTRDDRRLVYDKGAYVVHLLREELGEEAFWKGIKKYTQKYRGKSVDSKDFQKEMESASGKKLNDFFDKWVYSHS
jgi:aminopeptidase N